MLAPEEGVDPVPRGGKGGAVLVAQQAPLQLLHLDEHGHSASLVVGEEVHHHLCARRGGERWERAVLASVSATGEGGARAVRAC